MSEIRSVVVGSCKRSSRKRLAGTVREVVPVAAGVLFVAVVGDVLVAVAVGERFAVAVGVVRAPAAAAAVLGADVLPGRVVPRLVCSAGWEY